MITGSQKDHARLREMVCNHMISSPELNEFIINNYAYYDLNVTNAETHLQGKNMRTLGSYATDAEIFTASDLLGTQIFMAIMSGNQGVWHPYTTNQLGAQQQMSIYLTFIPFGRNQNGLCNHYEVVVSVS